MNTLPLGIRAPRLEDVPLYAAQLADREVSRWLDDTCQRPLTLQQVEAFVFQDIWCRWAIEFEGTFAGLTGLEPIRNSVETARLFIVIGRRDVWKRGVGTAVLAKVLYQAFHGLGLRRVVSDYLEPNLGSAVIHRRNGFVEEGRLREDAWRDGRWTDRILLSVLRAEYLDRNSREIQTVVNRNAGLLHSEAAARHHDT